MTSVADLFAHAGVQYAGVVRWGTAVPLKAPGVYVISTSADANERSGHADAPLDSAAIQTLLDVRPEATVDAAAATPTLVESRLRAMWPSGEPIVYIGLAGTNTANRVEQFYKTRIGARAPHAGGWPVKMLKSDLLYVHYGPTDNPAPIESRMVADFVTNVPAGVRRAVADPSAPLPFANLTFPGGRRKSHGFKAVKAPRNVASKSSHSRQAHDSVNAPALPHTPSPEAQGAVRSTQNVTDADLSKGQLRVRRVSKVIFPTNKGQVRVELGGETFTASWDPQTFGDKERSGIIQIEKGVLGNHVEAGGPRRIECTPASYRIS